jgi:hypothetical protein
MISINLVEGGLLEIFFWTNADFMQGLLDQQR